MKGGDLDNRPTPRYYVMAEVVFVRSETQKEETTGKWRKKTSTRTVVTWLPDIQALSELWKFSERMGVRLELVFTDELVADGPELWDMLEETPAAHPFNDYHVFESVDRIIKILPYRPDLRGVIDLPSRSGLYGGMGLTIASLR